MQFWGNTTDGRIHQGDTLKQTLTKTFFSSRVPPNAKTKYNSRYQRLLDGQVSYIEEKQRRMLNYREQSTVFIHLSGN